MSELLEQLGHDVQLTGRNIQLRTSAYQAQMKCPFHKEGQERHPSLTIKLRGEGVPAGTYWCFRCEAAGWIDSLVAAWLGVSLREGKAYCAGYGWESPAAVPKTKQIAAPPVWIPGSALQGDDAGFYLESRGIDSGIGRLFEVVRQEDFIVFPVRNERWQVVGLQRRGLWGKSFYNLEGWEKGDVVYGLYRVRSEERLPVVGICESIIDALTVWSAGWPAVALFGAHVSDRQLQLLRGLGTRRFVIGTDNDEAGEHVAAALIKLLRGQARVLRWPFREGCKDWNDEGVEEIKKRLDIWRTPPRVFEERDELE